ncbi:MAG TPA: hypothetical protein VNQ74_01930 [Burkholderiaceae bacterium]|nr:hypothetical protein [Burkholderiaceae bacterium]
MVDPCASGCQFEPGLNAQTRLLPVPPVHWQSLDDRLPQLALDPVLTGCQSFEFAFTVLA